MEKRPGEGEIVPTTTDDHDPEHFAVLSQTETGKAATGGSTSMPQLEAAKDGEQETTKKGFCNRGLGVKHFRSRCRHGVTLLFAVDGAA
jgi:hypothetical protein